MTCEGCAARARVAVRVRPSNLLTLHESRPEMRLIYQLAEGAHMAGYKMYKSIPNPLKLFIPKILKSSKITSKIISPRIQSLKMNI